MRAWGLAGAEAEAAVVVAPAVETGAGTDRAPGCPGAVLTLREQCEGSAVARR